jgi:hypothetical protein
VNLLYFGLFNPSITLPYPFTSYPPFFNSFQYTSLYPLPSHLMLCNITDALSFSFPFPLSLSSTEYFHYYKHVLHLNLDMITLVICALVYLLYLSSMYERKHAAFVFLSGLLHLAWCPPIVSIYLQTTGHYSLWLSKTQVCIYTNFLDLFTSSRAPGL